VTDRVLTRSSETIGGTDPSPSRPQRVSAAPMALAATQSVATSPSTDYIVAEGLEKVYPNGTHAVKGVSFRVAKGEIFGVLGPNGAGKSTLIGMLGTLVRPTKGVAKVGGLDVLHNQKQVRQNLGFAMQEAGVDELATGREFLTLQGKLYNVPKDKLATRSAQLLKLFELEAAADKRISSYSGGMKRRIDLASALIHFPPALFLDEPTEGLDPRSRQTMWRILKRLRQQLQTTILLSTHYMDEADKLCDRIAIIDQGKIVVQDTPERLKASVGGASIVLDYPTAAANIPVAEAALQKAKLGTRLQRTGTSLVVYVSDAAESTPKVLRVLESARASPQTLKIQQPSLDDVYLKYTGRKIEDAEAKPVEEAKK
jgi:ABC-2 type transport system ATP-binding protein